MRIPLSWLAEFVELPKDATARDVMAELVKVGFEEEATHGGGVTGPVVVGEVLEFVDEPQSNGKTIRWCQVKISQNTTNGIVCGARNFFVGDKVVVALPGAELPGGFKISARKTYGHVSDGMICSARELGMGEDHSGILRLSELELDPEIGTDALQLLGLSDSAAEVNVTPDRGYCLSIRGIAREYSHATRKKFTDPASKLQPVALSGYEAKILDQAPIHGKAGCTQFLTLEVAGIDPNAPTPDWMAGRLRLAGMRSISIAVDITNYVMLELGQPLHAYDADKLTGSIAVRRANPGEKLETLDGKVRDLDPEDLLITDDSGPIGIAGVMGGAKTEVSSATKRIILEAASFDEISIARSSRRHKLPSEASRRFERGVDPDVTARALIRAAELMVLLAKGKITGVGGVVGQSTEREQIELPIDFASRHVGVNYPESTVAELLTEIGCKVSKTKDSFLVIPPSWRPDLTHKTDLVEEVARLDGYENIPSRIPVAPPGRGLNKKQKTRRRILDSLTSAGFVEVLNYPFLSESQNSIFTAGEALLLQNPLQGDAPELRKSLIPGLLAAASRNVSRGNLSLALIEEGSVFLSGQEKPVSDLPLGNQRPDEKTLAALLATIPDQPRMIAGLVSGSWTELSPGQEVQAVDYSHALAAVEKVLRASGLNFELLQSEIQGLHPGRGAYVLVGGQRVGIVGELHPVIAVEHNLSGRIAVFELNLDTLVTLAPDLISAKELRTMPAATEDISLVVPEQLSAQELLATLREGAGDLLENISLVDVYRGNNLAEGKKSMTFSMLFRAQDRTLTQAELNLAKSAALDLARSKHGAELRA